MKTVTRQNLHTIDDLLQYADQQFIAAGLYYGHGTDNPWDDAVALVLHVLGLAIDVDASVRHRAISQSACDRVLSVIDRRINDRIPVPYLTHEAWFAGLAFYVDRRVLIPRSPIAELIEQQFMPWVQSRSVRRILDIGTGSACIAIACAYAFPNASVDAVDIDNDALIVAKRNIAKHQLLTRVVPLQSDLFSALDGKQYDIIIANPPYVAAEDFAALPPEYQHEPDVALLSQEGGLAHAKQILHVAARYLTETGILVVEVGNGRAALVQQCPQSPFVWLEFAHGGEGVFLLSARDLI